jgi:hypothetical protein
MTIGNGYCPMCNVYYIVGTAHVCINKTYSVTNTNVTFAELRRKFIAEECPIGTVVRIGKEVYMKTTEGWVESFTSLYHRNKELDNLVSDSKDFQWINYIQLPAEKVLSDYLGHRSLDKALRELQDIYGW